MKLFAKPLVGLLAVALLALAVVGCSDKDKQENPGLVDRVVDTVAMAVAESLSQAKVPAGSSIEVAGDTPTPILNESGDVPRVADLMIDDTLLYAVYDGGLVTYNLDTKQYDLVDVGEKINALAWHAGELFAGGDHLWSVAGDGLIPVECEVKGEINALCTYGPSLMIGTTEALYARNVLGTIALMQDIDVSRIAPDRDGLWVGTSGQGLYRFDGENFKKRFLTRDSSLFDYVTALAYNRQHLYLGTNSGLFVYDGGSWQQHTIEEGLPDDRVSSIDASDWVVYVGTERGLVSYFENEFKPVAQMESQSIAVVRKGGGRIIAGTSGDGVIIKSGPAVTTLVEPWHTGDTEIASLVM